MNKMNESILKKFVALVSEDNVDIFKQTLCDSLNPIYVEYSMRVCDFIVTLSTYNVSSETFTITSFATINIYKIHGLFDNIYTFSNLYIDVICAEPSTKYQGFNLINFIKYLSCNMIFNEKETFKKYNPNTTDEQLQTYKEKYPNSFPKLLLSSVPAQIGFYISQGFILDAFLGNYIKPAYNPSTKQYKIYVNGVPLFNNKYLKKHSIFNKITKTIKTLLRFKKSKTSSIENMEDDSNYQMDSVEFSDRIYKLLKSSNGLINMQTPNNMDCSKYLESNDCTVIDIGRVNPDDNNVNPNCVAAIKSFLTFYDMFIVKKLSVIFLYRSIKDIYTEFKKNVVLKLSKPTILKIKSLIYYFMTYVNII